MRWSQCLNIIILKCIWLLLPTLLELLFFIERFSLKYLFLDLILESESFQILGEVMNNQHIIPQTAQNVYFYVRW